MAGIGWRLERLMNQGFAGATAAYATGAAVMALPWVLTTAVLVTLPAIIGRSVELAGAGTIVNVAYAIALLMTGPLQVVISRYAADRLYEGRLRAIAAPLCRGLAAAFLICGIPAALVLFALDLPPRSVLWGAALCATVGAQWTALSVGNGLCSPGLVLGAVAAGSALSLLLAAVLVVFAGLGVPGYLFGLISGQALTLLVLLVGLFRALPDEADEGASLLPAFRDYAPLAVAGLAFNASLWVDKLIVWCLVGGETAALHGRASTLAWFSAIPCLAWLFVEVETAFHRRFRKFYLALEGGASLDELRRGVRGLVSEAARLLGGAISVQAGVTAFLELGSEPLSRWLGLPPSALLPCRLLLVAAGAQVIGMLGLILLYYFDLRREACLSAVALLIAVASFTAAASIAGLPPSVGPLLGCSLGAVVTWRRVFRGIREVLPHTLLGQPFGTKRTRRPTAIGPRSRPKQNPIASQETA
jgi:uncharacterized membrane protein